jgi:hypothetical protein
MARGGKQKGAGRPKGMLNKKTIEQKMFSERLRERINLKADKWLEAIEKSAVGFEIETGKVDDEGKKVKKKVGPNPIAWDIAMNRAFGKVTDNIDLKVEGQLTLVEIMNERRKAAEKIIQNRRAEQKS